MAIETAAKVQQVSKASSDELLRKFAEAEADSDSEKAARAVKRRKIRRGVPEGEICDGSGRAGLLGRPRSAVLRRRGLVKNRSVLASIQKTWSKAVRGASTVFIHKHYNTHKRLISDLA